MLAGMVPPIRRIQAACGWVDRLNACCGKRYWPTAYLWQQPGLLHLIPVAELIASTTFMPRAGPANIQIKTKICQACEGL